MLEIWYSIVLFRVWSVEIGRPWKYDLILLFDLMSERINI